MCVCVCKRNRKIEIGRRHTKERQIVYKIARIKIDLTFLALLFGVVLLAATTSHDQPVYSCTVIPQINMPL